MAADTPAASPAEAPAAAPRERRKKLIALAGLALLLAGGGSAGAWIATQGIGGRQAPTGPVEKKPAKTPHFLTLEPFVVNLQDPGGERYAQIGITLQFEDPMLEVSLKQRLPAVRNNILLLISSKRVDELLSMDGKRQLASQIRSRAALGLGLGLEWPSPGSAGRPPENPIQEVLFSQFIVQ